MTASRTAIVIGGGIAGAVAAMALQKAGIEATIYEAYDTPADGIGGLLTIAPNGLDALSIIGADDAVRGVGQPMIRTVIVDGRGRRIAAFPGLADLPPSQAVWRPELYRALHDCAVMCGIQTEYGRRLTGVAETPTGITARFTDGSTASADVLIGADGIRSTVRTLIDPSAPGTDHVPLLNFGAVADIKLPTETDTTFFVFGKGAFLGYWVQPDDRTAWFINLPHPEPMTPAQARSEPGSRWLDLLASVCADETPAGELLQHTRADQLLALGSIEILPSVPHWHRGRMVLVGDAVHAPSPSSGQGASLAAESAIQLARCLRDIPDLRTAFATYERLRRPRAERVAARAKRTNNSKTLGPGAIALMRLLIPFAVKTFLTPEKTLGLEQRHRIDWDIPVRPS